MYKIGELIHYGNTGVCRVSDITEGDFLGQGKKSLFYILAPLYQSYTITIPVDSTKMFMRKIISKSEAEKLIDIIPEINAQGYHCSNLRELSEHYSAFLDTHNCKDLIELTMSLYDKKQDMEKQKRKFGAVDERFMKQAEELLFGELAAALEIAKEKVPEYIEERMKFERASVV